MDFILKRIKIKPESYAATNMQAPTTSVSSKRNAAAAPLEWPIKSVSPSTFSFSRMCCQKIQVEHLKRVVLISKKKKKNQYRQPDGSTSSQRIWHLCDSDTLELWRMLAQTIGEPRIKVALCNITLTIARHNDNFSNTHFVYWWFSCGFLVGFSNFCSNNLKKKIQTKKNKQNENLGL